MESAKTITRALVLAAASFSGLGLGTAILADEASRFSETIRSSRDQATSPGTPELYARTRAERAQWLAVRNTRTRFNRGGWTVAHGQRMARKARNVKANRGRHRG